MIELGVIAALIVGVNEMMKHFLPISFVLFGILVMLLIHWYPISDCIFIPKLLKRTLDILKEKSKIITIYMSHNEGQRTNRKCKGKN